MTGVAPVAARASLVYGDEGDDSDDDDHKTADDHKTDDDSSSRPAIRHPGFLRLLEFGFWWPDQFFWVLRLHGEPRVDRKHGFCFTGLHV